MRRRALHRRKPALLMIVHGPFPPDPRVEREARVARSLGYEVDVVALREGGQSPFDELDGLRVFRLPVEHRRGSSFAAAAAEYAAFTALATVKALTLDRARAYSVVHVHNPPDFLMLAALLPKVLGARIVFDVHDLASDMFAMRFEGRPGARLLERALGAFERAAAGLSDVVLTVHRPYMRELIARGVPEAKIEVVMNSLDHAIASTMPNRREGGDFTVVYHGSITPHYGVELLVEAAALAAPVIRGLKLKILGDGDALSRAQDRAKELGLSDLVEFSGGYVPHADALRVAATASVGVVPNLPIRLNRFALSSKLLEYVALGVPAVCADLPTLREHFDDDEVKFFEAGSAAALAEAIVEVSHDPLEARRRAQNALRRYNDQYAWPPNAARYAAILDRWRPR